MVVARVDVGVSGVVGERGAVEPFECCDTASGNSAMVCIGDVGAPDEQHRLRAEIARVSEKLLHCKCHHNLHCQLHSNPLLITN